MSENLIRKPFTTTRLEEERAQDKGKVIAVRFNDEELAALERDKEILDQVIRELEDLQAKVKEDFERDAC